MKRALSLLATLVVLTSTLTAADKPLKPDPTAPAAKKFKDVDPQTFDKLRKTEKDAVVLDVRTREEYDRGHIPGAVLIDIGSGKFDQEIAKLDKSKTYLVHCASGGRSSRACKKMADAKFSHLFNLQGGMNAWEKAGKPVEK